jgi:hypothetical protein
MPSPLEDVWAADLKFLGSRHRRVRDWAVPLNESLALVKLPDESALAGEGFAALSQKSDGFSQDLEEELDGAQEIPQRSGRIGKSPPECRRDFLVVV